MGLKNLIEKRNDILFAEIGALIHDLGKLSRRFMLQSCMDYVDFFYDHSLIFGRDFLDINENNSNRLYNKTEEALSEIISQINEDIKKGIFNEYEKILDYIKEQISEITSNNKARSFINLLKSKESKDNLWKSIENYIEKEINITINNENASINIIDLISKHHNSEKKYGILSKIIDKYLLNQLIYSDGLDSGIDKMVSENEFAKQSKKFTFISTAFGYEKENIDLNLNDNNENSLTKIRKKYSEVLANILQDLKNNPLNIENWIEKREKLLKETKKAFLKALGETRRPANDVTLWDHSFSVASLYKSALAQVILYSWKEPQKMKWKLLSIRFNSDDFYFSVNKIGNVLGRKEIVKRILDNIKYILEVVIPIGNEIYRDENGSIFLVPECTDENYIFQIYENSWNIIKDVKLKAFLTYEGNWIDKTLKEIVKRHSNIKELIESLSSFISKGLFIPSINVSIQPSRGALNIGKEISTYYKHSVDIECLKGKWENGEKFAGECRVCRYKPIPFPEENKKLEKKAYERKICLDCLKFSSDRVKKWDKNKNWTAEEPEQPSFDTTIWMNEVADENNRVALVYISFDLEKWLNGEMLNTFLSKPLLDEKFKNSFNDNFQNYIENISEYEKFIDLISKSLEEDNFDFELEVGEKKLKVKEFLKILGCHEKKPSELFDLIVNNREPDWNNRYKGSLEQTDENIYKSMVFFLFLTRKHPSFARLGRIWETTKNFGIEVFNEVKNKLNKKKRIIIEFEENTNLEITHTFYFKDKNDKKCEIVILDKNRGALISNTEDLELPENEIELYEEFFREKLGCLKNPKMKETDFYPVIPFQFEPTKTLFFMPLKEAWEVINLIKKEYEIQFNKVQNSLPIKVGFVAFHKKTPMFVVLDTAKRLYSKKISEKKFKIKNIIEIDPQKNCKLFDGKIGNKVKEITFENNEKDLEYHFSYSTGDPNIEDVFHPYFMVENKDGWKTYVDGDWKTIKHVKELEKGDEVIFYPSEFDFIWLDTNTRRFIIWEKERKHWLFKGKFPKPYNIKDIEKFEKLRILLFKKLSLTNSQLLNIYGLLITKMQSWGLDKKDLLINDFEFENFVENTILSNPLRLKVSDTTEKGKITIEDFKFIKDSILNGIFFDLMDMWHTILKRKFKEEDNG